MTPNYSYPYEPHYKVYTPPPSKYPILCKIALKLYRRPLKFLKTLNLYTYHSILNYLKTKSDINLFDFSEVPKLNFSLKYLFVKIFTTKDTERIKNIYFVIQKY